MAMHRDLRTVRRIKDLSSDTHTRLRRAVAFFSRRSYFSRLWGVSLAHSTSQLISELDITGGDERKVGYYAGLIVSYL